MNIELKPFCRDYAKELAAALNNPRVLANLRDGLPYPYTEKDGESYINFILAQNPKDRIVRAILVDGKCVGNVGAFRQPNIHFRTAELGYYLAEPYWGKGIMTGAVGELCHLIFDTTDIVRVYAEPFAYNRGSCRVLEKNGFNFEGILRKNAFKDGRFLDMRLYARLKEEII